MRLGKAMGLALAAWAAVVAVLVTAVYTRGAYDGPTAELKLDLAHPDVLLQSRQLSALPRDLVALPGLRDVLTQDFVQYYEEHPDRLSLDGTLRRLAYENGLSWQERLVATVLDAPAEVALWSDGKGRLAYAALLLEKNAAAQAIEQLAKVALPENQLSRAGALEVDGQLRPVYVLTLRRDSALVFVSTGSRLIVFTHPGMLLDAQRQPAGGASTLVESLLRHGDAPWRADFALGALPAGSRHAITAKAAWLSFGYQHFFPQVHAVRLDVGQPAWSLSVAAAPGVWQDWPRAARTAWGSLPRGAALCAALPVTWERAAAPMAATLGSDASALTADLEPGAGICWYPVNGLYAPVLALHFKPGTAARHDGELRTLLEKSAAPGARPTAERTLAGGHLWSTDVPNAFGYQRTGNDRVHRLTLLRQGDAVLASVDHRAIEQAQAVAGKTWPALADDHPGGPLLVSGLPELGQLLQAESLRLTQDTPAFRQLVQKQLKPRLDALAAGGQLAFAASGAAGSAGAKWQWKPLVAVPGQGK